MSGMRWSEKEIEILRNNYDNGAVAVSKILGRTQASVILMANKIGRKSAYNPWRKSNVGKLLNGEDEAYYWMGFLMADGHFGEKRLRLKLAKKDKEHLKKFGRFIEYTGKITSYITRLGGKSYHGCRITCMDTIMIPEIMERFGLVANKTENPPSGLPTGTDEQLLALVEGFIDGDGCMRTGKKRRFCNIVVKVHSSWLEMLKKMADLVYRLSGCASGLPKLNKKGYAEWVISNSMITKFLKRKSVEMKLPVLDRKWKKIDEWLIGKQERAMKRIEDIRVMVQEGLYQSQIAKKLGVDDSVIFGLAKRNGITIQKCGYPRYSLKGVM